ncbi:HU family DNA-binding protein [Streptomyces microflavus]|uniref:DNA-binding protein HU 2 n=2 Tax=Streptomyces microflavus TaxID=1919 RepID=A0A6N9V0S4_STRMI|nr:MULTISPECIES: HU family DNA-binding protein [Streptomyces]MBK3586075.1 HU family DNA-binding protein [Streptomyces sp. MBT57]AGK80338.1 Histone family protein DNA-binding protein [Streptomyces microflavus DSM 40593]MBK5993728.1 HU family DNA-binding protein [Streptomyces sp. MBT58]MBW3361457.1 HU family DNA-binding protein [Streptomyces sp. 09ZI22]MCX4655481.1 HU family DNA-binding protein [Streptomyces microflavus]
MNKAQLVEAIADKVGGRQQAADAVDAVLDAIVRAVVAGDRVSVTGFGSFEKVDRPARYARNPQTGERVRVKKTSVPRFRAGQGFKDLVSGSKKLPKNDVAVKKAPKGSLTGGSSAARTTVKAAAAKKSVAKKATAKKTTAKKAVAPAKKTTATAKKATAKKATATAKKATPAAKKATPAKKATATAKKTAPAKKATAKKAPAKKTTARTTTAKKATARKK